MNFSNLNPSHGLQFFMWVLPPGYSPSGTDCSSVSPPWGHKSCQQTCSSVGSSLHRSTAPARSLLVPLLGIHLLQCGALPGLQVEICSTVHLHGLQWDSLPHLGLLHRLWGNLCSNPCSTSFPSFCTDLGVYRVVLSQSHFSIALQVFFPFLNYVILEALPLLMTGLALASGRSILKTAGIGSIGHRRSFQQLLTETTPVAPPATKTLPCKPDAPVMIHTTKLIIFFLQKPAHLWYDFIGMVLLFYLAIILVDNSRHNLGYQHSQLSSTEVCEIACKPVPCFVCYYRHSQCPCNTEEPDCSCIFCSEPSSV